MWKIVITLFLVLPYAFGSFLVTTFCLLFGVMCWLLTGQGKRERKDLGCGRRRWLYVNGATSSAFWGDTETDTRQLRTDPQSVVAAEICFVWWINFRTDDGVAARQGFIKTQTPLLMARVLRYLQFITMLGARPVWSTASVSAGPGVWTGAAADQSGVVDPGK